MVAALSLAVAAAWAVETKKWVVSQTQDYDSGEMRNVALSSKGRIGLAPARKLVIDAGAAQIWTVAADGRGNVYAGGADGKIYVSRNGVAATVLAAPGSGSVFALTLTQRRCCGGISPSARSTNPAAGTSLIHETKRATIGRWS